MIASTFHKPSVGGVSTTPYNRMVSQPEPTVTIVEPLPFRQDLSLAAIKERYLKVTGFPNAAVSINYHESGFRVGIKYDKIGVMTGSGQCVGQGAMWAKMGFDSFTINQLENAEIIRL